MYHGLRAKQQNKVWADLRVWIDSKTRKLLIPLSSQRTYKRTTKFFEKFKLHTDKPNLQNQSKVPTNGRTKNRVRDISENEIKITSFYNVLIFFFSIWRFWEFSKQPKILWV